MLFLYIQIDCTHLQNLMFQCLSLYEKPFCLLLPSLDFANTFLFFIFRSNFILSRRSFYLQQINFFSETTEEYNFEEYPKYYIFTFFNLINGNSDLLLNVTDILSLWENTFEIYFGVDSSMQVMYNIMLLELNNAGYKILKDVLRKLSSLTGDLVTLANLQICQIIFPVKHIK